MRIARVFPRRTSYTPTDDYAFVGDPPLWRPSDIGEVHVSCTFTWDKPEAERLAEAWRIHLGVPVRLGGPAYGSPCDTFTPGRFVKGGVVFTSRGCDRRCPWCLVPEREGRLHLLPISDGNVINDNNFAQTPKEHREMVYAMLRRQPRAAVFAGGIDARLVTDEFAEEMRSIRVNELFLAADTERSLPSLREAAGRLAFLSREKLRCFVMVGYGGETVEQAEARLEAVWQAGAVPFCQLYQPPDRFVAYPREWRALHKTWSRPAAMKAMHKEEVLLPAR
jgi:hypothetical protein